MIDLYVNGKRVDLIGSEKISIDYAMFSIDDISKRRGVRSYTFEVPKTVNNGQIFEVSEEVNNLTQIPYTRLDARLSVDGIDLGIRFCEFVSAKDTYSLNLYGISAGFFDAIKNKKLTQLDLTDLNHSYDFATVVGSRDNTSGYVYPIINYGIDDYIMNNAARVCNPMNLLPAIFMETLLEEICTQAGYILDNKLLDYTDYVDNPVVVPATGLVFANKYNAVFGIGTDTPCTLFFQSGPVNIMNIDSIITYDGNFYSLPYGGFFRWGGIHSFGNGIGKTEDYSCKYRFILTIENVSPIDHYVLIYMSGDQQYHSGVQQVGKVFVSSGTHTYTIEGELDATDFQWQGQNNKVFFPIGSTDVTIKAGSTFEIYEADEFSTIYYGAPVNCASLLPNITQAQLIKNFCQMFSAVPIVDEDNKTVTLERFNKVEINVSEAVDWSNKLDFTETPEVKFVPEDYAQKNYLKWDVDGDEIIPSGTNGSIKTYNENLEAEKDVVSLDFCSTNSDLQLMNIPVPRIGIFDAGSNQGQKKPRLLILYRKAVNSFDDTSDFRYQFSLDSEILSGSDELPLVRFIDSEFTYNLGFGNSLILYYYKTILDVLTNYRSVTCKIKLSASDINTLDFLKPVYIKHFNSYFYINEIKGYNVSGNESTQVELIKIF